jgi:hypothetical protein
MEYYSDPLECAICGELVYNAVTLSDGFSADLDCIVRWQKETRNASRSPLTCEYVSTTKIASASAAHLANTKVWPAFVPEQVLSIIYMDLVRAILAGDAWGVVHAIQSGINLNASLWPYYDDFTTFNEIHPGMAMSYYIGSCYKSFLHTNALAMAMDRLPDGHEIVELLLKNIDFDRNVYYFKITEMLECVLKKERSLELIISYIGPSLDFVNSNIYGFLYRLFENTRLELVPTAIRCLTPSARDSFAFWYACATGDMDHVSQSLEAGFNPEPDRIKKACLIFATRYNQPEILKKLYERLVIDPGLYNEFEVSLLIRDFNFKIECLRINFENLGNYSERMKSYFFTTVIDSFPVESESEKSPEHLDLIIKILTKTQDNLDLFLAICICRHFWNHAVIRKLCERGACLSRFNEVSKLSVEYAPQDVGGDIRVVHRGDTETIYSSNTWSHFEITFQERDLRFSFKP